MLKFIFVAQTFFESVETQRAGFIIGILLFGSLAALAAWPRKHRSAAEEVGGLPAPKHIEKKPSKCLKALCAPFVKAPIEFCALVALVLSWLFPYFPHHRGYYDTPGFRFVFSRDSEGPIDFGRVILIDLCILAVSAFAIYVARKDEK